MTENTEKVKIEVLNFIYKKTDSFDTYLCYSYKQINCIVYIIYNEHMRQTARG